MMLSHSNNNFGVYPLDPYAIHRWSALSGSSIQPGGKPNCRNNAAAWSLGVIWRQNMFLNSNMEINFHNNKHPDPLFFHHLLACFDKILTRKLESLLKYTNTRFHNLRPWRQYGSIISWGTTFDKRQSSHQSASNITQHNMYIFIFHIRNPGWSLTFGSMIHVYPCCLDPHRPQDHPTKPLSHRLIRPTGVVTSIQVNIKWLARGSPQNMASY